VPLNRTSLARELLELGITPGRVLMVHTRMSALGWVDGAETAVVGALLDALGPDGTLVAYTSWDEHDFDVDLPPFDPATARATPDNGRIPERVRTWPGAVRSVHPEASVAAVGARAAWIAEPHGDEAGYGAGTPFARIVEAQGQVLLLGAPLDTITLLHHAEAIARVPGKRTVTTRVAGRTLVDIDTCDGAFDYASLGLDDDEFAVIARDALAAGVGGRGRVGDATCHLFPARELVGFAVRWMEERFA
jgi:aminoglycoside 3-N-acetyltransferase